MKKKLLIYLMVVVVFPIEMFAWQGMSTPMLHVEGRYLKDPSGKNVLLHGWMQPIETWFNGGGNRYDNPTNWTDPNNVAGMLNFLNDAATVMSDVSPKYGRDHGWYASFVRVNCDFVGGWTQESGLVNQAQFDGWIQNFVVPYANHLRSRGLYLVLCATGPMMTPDNGTHNAGITEQARLRTFWSTVANAPGVKNADNIMFELMNEPVQVESYPGNGDWGSGSATYFQAFRNWIQPIINDIRNTGANNVIWVPCLGWQGEPHGWAQYPFTGSNIGVAAHYYPAYGGVYDNPTAVQNLWNSNYKPAADMWPMMITECYWFPGGTGYDDLFNGTTAGFGNALKNAMDNQGNVQYLIGFLADHLVDLTTSTPANCTLGSREATQAYFEWLPTYTWAAPSTGGCDPTPITPYLQVNDGAWQQTASVAVSSGAKVKFGPQPVSGGSWSWSGGGTSGSSREQTIYPTSSITATATYTNSCGAQSTQDFNVTVSGGTDYVKIQNRATGLYIDGMGRTSDGSNAGQWGSSSSDNQQWVIETSGSYVRFKNQATGLYLDGMGRTSDGSLVGQWSNSGSNNQQWTIEDIGSYKRIKNNASGLYIDGMGWSTNGSDLGQWSNSGSDAQQWTITNLKSTMAGSGGLSTVNEGTVNKINEDKIKIYPNPVIGMLNLQLPAIPKEIAIYSIEGKQLYRQNTVSENVEIDMSGFRPGIYFVKAIGQNETWTQKVLKK